MSTAGCSKGTGNAGWTTSYNYKMFWVSGNRKYQRNTFFPVEARIYRALYIFMVCGNMITLQAAYTRYDIFAVSHLGFYRPEWICQCGTAKHD